MATVLFEPLTPTFLVAVYAEAAPTDEEWARYLEVVEDMSDPFRALICSTGGGPGAAQRRSLERVLQDRPARAAVVTTSRAARGIVAAISWFTNDIKAFEPAKLREALSYLDLGPEDHPRALGLVGALSERMGVAGALGLTHTPKPSPNFFGPTKHD